MTRRSENTLGRWARLIAGLALLAGFAVTQQAAHASQLPADVNIYVTTFADDTATNTTATCLTTNAGCSLRNAVNLSDTFGYNTVVAIWLKSGTYLLQQGYLDMDSYATVYLNGTHSTQTIIDGSMNPVGSQVIYADAYNLTITGVTIQNGTGVDGGGIEDYESYALALSDVILTHNNADADKQDGYGGGIYIYAYYGVTLTNVQILHNAAYEGGGIYVYGIEEGGDYPQLVSANNVNINYNIACEYSEFYSTTLAPWASGNACVGYGEGGGIWDEYAVESLKNATINYNVAGAPADDSGEGGGIWTYQDGEQATRLTNVTVNGNTAGEYGGAIYSEAAFLVGTGVTISNNNTLDYGGGIYNYEYTYSSLSFHGLTLTNNTVGGLYYCTENSTKTAISCTGVSKAASFKSCPATYYECEYYGGNGGGIYNDEYGDTSIANLNGNGAAPSVISGNRAIDMGTSYHSYGGGIYNYYGTLQIQNTTFSNNTAYEGGGLEDYAFYATNIQNSTFTYNKALEDGGAIYEGYYELILDNVQVHYNNAGVETGGVFADSADYNTAGSTSITGNTAPLCKNLYEPCG